MTSPTDKKHSNYEFKKHTKDTTNLDTSGYKKVTVVCAWHVPLLIGFRSFAAIFLHNFDSNTLYIHYLIKVHPYPSAHFPCLHTTNALSLPCFGHVIFLFTRVIPCFLVPFHSHLTMLQFSSARFSCIWSDHVFFACKLAHNQCWSASKSCHGMLPCQHPFHVLTVSLQHYLTPLSHDNTFLTQHMIDITRTLALDKIIHVNPLPSPYLCRFTWSGPLHIRNNYPGIKCAIIVSYVWLGILVSFEISYPTIYAITMG